MQVGDVIYWNYDPNSLYRIEAIDGDYYDLTSLMSNERFSHYYYPFLSWYTSRSNKFRPGDRVYYVDKYKDNEIICGIIVEYRWHDGEKKAVPYCDWDNGDKDSWMPEDRLELLPFEIGDRVVYNDFLWMVY